MIFYKIIMFDILIFKIALSSNNYKMIIEII